MATDGRSIERRLGSGGRSANAAEQHVAGSEAVLASTELGLQGATVGQGTGIPERLPRKFGRYELLQLLGVGGMGRVYLANDPVLDRRVALKMPLLSGSGSAEHLERFFREARALAGLKHQHICSVYDAGIEGSIPYITMDFVSGASLSQVLQESSQLPVATVLEIVLRIAEAVQHAHEQGVIHRDLKPGNILMAGPLMPIVTDFGLARRLAAVGDEKLTGDGRILGTPAYMAPEQMRGDQRAVGVGSDIYALGVILFEMLAGTRPFAGEGVEFMAKVLRDRPPLICRLRPELSEEFEDLVQKMLAKEPGHRPESMAVVAESVRRLQQRVVVVPRVSGSQERELSTAREGFELRRRHVEALLKRGQYVAAIRELEKLGNESAAAAREVGEWARRKLPEAKAEARAMSPAGLAALLQTAQQLYSKSDYRGCEQLLEEIPELRRTEAIEELLRKARAREAESEALWLEIRDFERQQKLDGVEALVQRFLRLKPGHVQARRLLEALQSYGRLPVHRRNYKYEHGRLQPLPEPGFLAQWGLLAALTGIFVFLATWYGVVVYLKSGTQLLQVEIDDAWLQQMGGEVTLKVDGEEHSISVGRGDPNDAVVAVKFGSHDFSVLHNGVVVHAPKTFEILRDGHRVLQITPVDIRLLARAEFPPTAPPIAAQEPTDTDEMNPAESDAPELAGAAADAGAGTGRSAADSGDAGAAGAPAATASSEPVAGPAVIERSRGNVITQTANFSVLQGATLDQLVAWADQLPRDLYPHRVTLRANSGERIFDALADPNPERAEWIMRLTEVDQWAKALDGYRPVVVLPYRDGRSVRRLCIGTKHFVFYSAWYGNAVDMNAKIQEGMRDFRDIPDFFGSQHWLNSGHDYLLVRAPSDRSLVELHTPLSEPDLLRLLETARERDLRPIIIDHVHDGQVKPQLLAVLVNADARSRWGFSPRVSEPQLARMLPAVADHGGRPVYVVSASLVEGVVYRVIWRGIDPESLEEIERATRIGNVPVNGGAQNSPEVITGPDGLPLPAVVPFSADTAGRFQKAWAAHLGVPAEYTNSIGMRFRLIPPGKFLIGSTPEQIAAAKPNLFTKEDPQRATRADSESPQRMITLTRAFYLAETEVTQAQYEQVTGTNPSYWTEGTGDRRQAPVERVTWMDTGEFCNRLSTREGLEWAYRITPELITQTGVGGYRLPTEAEWEFSCRAGTSTLFCTGDDEQQLTEVAWFGDAEGHLSKQTALKKPNAFGLYDMHGNVYEWVHDAFRQDWYGTLAGVAAVNPRCDVGTDGKRIMRGGDYGFSSAEVRSASRDAYHYDSVFWDAGFRVALSVEAVRDMEAAAGRGVSGSRSGSGNE